MQELIKKLEEQYKKPISEFDEYGWTYISIYEELSEDFIREYQDKVDWYFISSHQNLSEDFIREFQDKVDLGINNLATLTTNLIGDTPMVISGKVVKSYNQYYNKQVAHYKSILELQNGRKTSRRIRRLHLKRKLKIEDYMHKTSRYIVNQLVSKGVNTLIIGKNDGWKQDINIGKVNNQKFVQIPFESLISKLQYKCSLVGINVELINESYTSKCSFLDGETIEKHEEYVGKRIHRGLFRSAQGTLINADVNGSYNILRKSKPKAFVDGVEGVVVHPVILQIIN